MQINYKTSAKGSRKGSTESRNRRIVIWIVFSLGVFLVLNTIYLFVLGVGSFEVLVLGAIGVGCWVLLFAWTPMHINQRVPSAVKAFLDNHPMKKEA